MPGSGGIYQERFISGAAPPPSLYIDNTPFGIAWLGVTTKAPSEDALYKFLITIGAGFGNSAYVRPSGNDTSAIVGNFLLPFKTIGAAITALGVLTSSALVIDAGTYNLDDINCPFGLKAPGSKYDIVCNVGVNIQYTGTYGLYCSSSADGSSGNIYGIGDFQTYSTTVTKVVDGVSNYQFNVSGASGIFNYNFNNLKSESTSGSVGLMRVGNYSGVNTTQINISSRAYTRTNTTLFLDTSCRANVTGLGTIDFIDDFTGLTGNVVVLKNPFQALIFNTTLTSRGNIFGGTSTESMIINNATNGSIKFVNVSFRVNQSSAAYAIVKIINNPAVMDNTLFERCKLANRFTTAQAVGGISFTTATAVSFKIVDTYGERNTGGVGVITNLIITGNGFMVEPNII